MSMRLSKPLNEYANKSTMHVVVANQILKSGRVVETGDRMKFYFCSTTSGCRKHQKAGDKVVAAVLADTYDLDYKTYASRFIRPFESICNIVFGTQITRELLDIESYSCVIPRVQTQLTRMLGMKTNDDPRFVRKNEDKHSTNSTKRLKPTKGTPTQVDIKSYFT